MKKINTGTKNYHLLFCFLTFLLIAQFSRAQKNENFYLYKKDWHTTKDMNNATYFVDVIQESDTEYICRFYNKYGPMIRQESYFDYDLTIPNGRFCWYDAQGDIDSTGFVYRGKKDGVWNYYDDGLKSTLTDIYNKGQLIEKNVHYNITDSVLEAAHPETTTYDNLSQNYSKYEIAYSLCLHKNSNKQDVFLMKSYEWYADAGVFEITQNDLQWKPGDTINNKVACYKVQSIDFQSSYKAVNSTVNQIINADSICTEEVFIEIKHIIPRFPGGDKKWDDYLHQNANLLALAHNRVPVGSYIVLVSFTIDKEGNISEVQAINDPGYGIAEVAVEAIKHAPHWIPAVENGENVLCSQYLSVNFSVATH